MKRVTEWIEPLVLVGNKLWCDIGLCSHPSTSRTCIINQEIRLKPPLQLQMEELPENFRGGGGTPIIGDPKKGRVWNDAQWRKSNDIIRPK